MQHMVSPLEGTASFNGKQILRLCNDTDGRVIPVAATNGAGVVLGNRKADGAKPDPRICLDESFRQGGNAELARFDTRSCFACHTFESTCSDCHRGQR